MNSFSLTRLLGWFRQLGALAVLALIWGMLTVPLWFSVRERRLRINEMDDWLAQHIALSQQIIVLPQAMQQFLKSAEWKRARFPLAQSYPLVLQALEAAGQNSGLKPLFLEPRPSEKQGDVFVKRFEITLQGPATALLKFLDVLEQAPFDYQLQKLEMEYDADDGAVKSSLELRLFSLVNDGVAVPEVVFDSSTLPDHALFFADTYPAIIAPLPAAGIGAGQGGQNVVQAPSFKIQGIFESEDYPTVLIDGQFYRMGESVHGYLIKSINSQRVVLLKDGKTFQLKMEQF